MESYFWKVYILSTYWKPPRKMPYIQTKSRYPW